MYWSGSSSVTEFIVSLSLSGLKRFIGGGPANPTMAAYEQRYKNPMLVESMRLRLEVSIHQNSKPGSHTSEVEQGGREKTSFMSFIQAASRRRGPDEGWLLLPQKSRLKVGFPTLNDLRIPHRCADI